MAQLAKSGAAHAFGISPEMASALTDPVRSRILMEISIRPLSPSQFVEKVGGDLSSVSRHFRQLERWGYAEIVEEKPGRRRGASVEHIYRGIQRAYFDNQTWSSLPRPDRDALSRSILDSYFAQIAEAVEAGTFDQELDTHLSLDVVALDRKAWVQLGTRLDEILESLADLEIEATERGIETPSEIIPVSVGLAAFRAPRPVEDILNTQRRRTTGDGSLLKISPQIAKALSNRLRSRILRELDERPMSCSQFVEEVGGDPSYVARCFRELAAWGLIELIAERRGGRHGGGVERTYRSVQHLFFDRETWKTMPSFLRTEVSSLLLSSYAGCFAEAIEAGTLDAEADRHLSWKPLAVDRPGWERIVDALVDVLDWLGQLQEESLERSGHEPQRLIPTTTGLACFRCPTESQRR